MATILTGVDPHVIRQILKESIQLNRAMLEIDSLPQDQVTKRKLQISQAEILRLLLSPKDRDLIP